MLSKKRPLIIVTAYLALTLFLNIVNAEQSGEAALHRPIVEELILLLLAKPEIKQELEGSIADAGILGVYTLDEYYNLLDDMVVWIPTGRDLYRKVVEFYYLIDHSQILREDALFNRWVKKFAEEWGSFLDTPESAESVATFYTNPGSFDFHMEDYYPAPSGWLTFNQFFAREIKPGKRPIAEPCKNTVIVSPADTHFVEQKPVNNAIVDIKGFKWSVLDLLNLSEDDDEQTQQYKERFKDGIFMHAFLNVDDYHRYHVPVGGRVVHIENIPGRMILDVERHKDGSLHAVDGSTYQFQQQRGLVIIDSDNDPDSKGVGLVAVLPIGMAQVSSVTITPDVGDVLAKGDEFGYFQFGGSDIVILFEKDRVEIDAVPKEQYKQGTRIGQGKTN